MTDNKLSSDTFGLNIILLTAISSISLSLYDNNKTIMPTTTAKYQCVRENKYSWGMEKLKYTQSFVDSEKEDFDIIASFAQRMVSKSKDIDVEIQEVINKRFWDML